MHGILSTFRDDRWLYFKQSVTVRKDREDTANPFNSICSQFTQTSVASEAGVHANLQIHGMSKKEKREIKIPQSIRAPADEVVRLVQLLLLRPPGPGAGPDGGGAAASRGL